MTPYLRAANVTDGNLLLDDVKTMNFTPCEQRRYALDPGDVLVTEGSGSRGTVGAGAAWPGSEEPTMLQNTLIRLRARAHVDPRFLYWWSRHAYGSGMYAAAAQGLAIWHLSAERVRALPFIDFAIDEQRRIAGFLDDQVDRLDQLIERRRDQIDLLTERFDAQFRKILAGEGSGAPPPAAPWVSALGSRAELRPLSRLLTLQRGVDLTEIERAPGRIPVITTGGIAGYHSKAIAPGPGVVIGRYGSVGNVFWLDQAYWPHNTTLYVRDFQGNYERYIYYLLRIYPYDRLQARAAVPGINRNDMKSDPMPWLPLDDQIRAARECDSAEDQLRGCLSQLEVSAKLTKDRKQALITAAVTGQFDVTTARSFA